MDIKRATASGLGLLGSYSVSILSFIQDFDVLPVLSEVVGLIAGLAGSVLTLSLATQHLANARKSRAEARIMEAEAYLKEKSKDELGKTDGGTDGLD